MDKYQLVELIKEAREASDDAVVKAYTQSASATSGITGYDLRGPAYNLYPVITPIRNMLPRINGGFGIQANWRAVTGINTANLSPGVGEGNRGGVSTDSTADYLAAYRSLGLEQSVTFEAQYAGMGFQDVKALAALGLLRSMMIAEEKVLLGGNTSYALGTTPTPTVVGSTTGGTLAAATYNVMCVAMTHEAFMAFSVANGLQATVTRTNADGSTDTYNGGLATKSSAGSATTTGATSSMAVSVTPVRGAFAYAWYWGTAGNELLGAITTINSYVIRANATGTQNISAITAGDHSRNGLVFDGLLSMATNPTWNGYYAAQATGTPGTGTGLTAGTDGTITEIDNALQYFWDTYRISPTKIFVNSQEASFIRKKVLTGGTAAAQRFVLQQSTDGTIRGGYQVKSYLNPFTMDGPAELAIKIHPNMPPGTIMFVTEEIPYPVSNLGNVMQIMTRQDYYQVEWPQRSRKYEMGIYMDGVFQHFAPFSLGVITNIAPA